MLPGRLSQLLPAALRRGLATQASHQAAPTQACLEGSRGVIRIAGAGLVHFLQVRRRRRRCLLMPLSWLAAASQTNTCSALMPRVAASRASSL